MGFDTQEIMTKTPSSPSADTGRDYRETVFLPATDFPMRAGLPKKEPELLAQWSERAQYDRLRQQRKGAPLFVLHDGPPYANGRIHIGHALNKILKDFVVRSQFMLGRDVDYRPGWDCHGLPIEWKIEEQFRKDGKSKDDIDKATFRKACRDYADEWIDTQAEDFKRLGVLADFDNRYVTMDFETEAKIVAEFHKFKNKGLVYRGSKPVMWSPVEQTALADAEVEYHDHTSPTIWVKFPIAGTESADSAIDQLLSFQAEKASLVIWTTTPWTIPANRAISYSPEITYAVYEVEAMEADLEFEPWAKVGEHLIVAEARAEDVRTHAKIKSWKHLGALDPAGLVCRHPLADLHSGYGFAVPLLSGDHVTDDAGTGFVHTAPGHGADDYEVWRAHGHHEIPETVGPDGRYYDHVPLFGGFQIIETEGKKTGKFGPANSAVIDKLVEAGNLLARGRVEHSYPMSWRSKAPVIFRNTPQWFICMGDSEGLRATALDAIEATTFYPAQGKNRILSMVEDRPDWLISRQRAWGTPLAMFVDKTTHRPLHDDAVDARILAAIREGGADAWFTTPASVFLGEGYDPERYEKVEDILDVWFDSGCTHAFTLEGHEGSHWPADLYLEGSDQHRGWFQSSLLEACGTRGQAPYKAVLTHGFVLDEQGRKMSKSLGNVVDPNKVIDQSGAEILRLWVAMSDVHYDLRCGPEILKTASDAYRKLRNTLRYLLGALADYDPAEAVDTADMPSLERWVLHRLAETDVAVRAAYKRYDVREAFEHLFTLANRDLSAIHFDIRKDSLYCDQPDTPTRRACRTVMDITFKALCRWLAPILAFTTEEAWMTRYGAEHSVLDEPAEALPQAWQNPDLSSRWQKILQVREVVTGALEIERREKRIRSSLEAAPDVYIHDPDLLAAFEGLSAADIFITSAATLHHAPPPDGSFVLPHIAGVGVVPTKAEGEKCVRSWKVLPIDQMVQDPDGQWLTRRDWDAAQAWDKTHKQAAHV